MNTDGFEKMVVVPTGRDEGSGMIYVFFTCQNLTKKTHTRFATLGFEPSTSQQQIGALSARPQCPAVIINSFKEFKRDTRFCKHAVLVTQPHLNERGMEEEGQNGKKRGGG
jgi:hypothetical protein